VFNITMGGRVIIEGRATIVRVVKGVDEQYVVAFPNGDRVQRFVDPFGQADPAKHLAHLEAARHGGQQ
jgi:hypothetical protein